MPKKRKAAEYAMAKKRKAATKSNAASTRGPTKKPTAKRPAPEKRPKRRGTDLDVTALVQSTPGIAAVVDDPDSLLHWFGQYLKVNVDPESNTFKAKRDDLQRFLGFFHDKHKCFDCDKWTPSITKAYIRWLPKQKARNPRGKPTDRRLAPSTCARNVDTLRHAARWVHRQRPFPVGIPFDRRDTIEVEEPGWQGLTDTDITRLKSAAEQLVAIQTKKSQRPRRNYALLLVGLHTGLRVEELNSLELSQYHGKHLRNVHRTKNGRFQNFFLDKSVRETLDEYIREERGRETGYLFWSKSGKKLAQSDVYEAFKRIAAQANATLPSEEHIQIHPHLLRHTFLRAVTDKGDIRAAREVSGLKTDKYLWRYTKLTEEQVEKAVTGLYDD